MKPLHETINPFLDMIICLFSPIVCGACLVGAAFCGAALFAIGNQELRNHYRLDVLTPLVLLIVVAIIAFFLPTFCEHCIFEKEIGSFRGADYAQFYYLTQTCVLPHAELEFDPNGHSYTLSLRLRYQYDEILHAYQEMQRRHRVYYNFQKYNIPGTTCQVQMAISRHTAKRLVAQMRSSGSRPEKFVILETTVEGITNCKLPPKMQFVSRWDLAVLRQRLLSSPNHLVTAALDIGVTTHLDAQFIDFCDTLIDTDEQLINLPSINWAHLTSG